MLLVSKMIYVYKLNGFVSCAPKFLNLTSKMELTVGQGLVLRLTINQPTVIPRSRREPANQQGDWWIGGYEDRPSEATPAGQTQGDNPQGNLTSPHFIIPGKTISFQNWRRMRH